MNEGDDINDNTVGKKQRAPNKWRKRAETEQGQLYMQSYDRDEEVHFALLPCNYNILKKNKKRMTNKEKE